IGQQQIVPGDESACFERFGMTNALTSVVADKSVDDGKMNLCALQQRSRHFSGSQPVPVVVILCPQGQDVHEVLQTQGKQVFFVGLVFTKIDSEMRIQPVL